MAATGLVGLSFAAEPVACTLEYMPVCGVDGMTYGNKCAAGEVEIAHEGECKPTKPVLQLPTARSTDSLDDIVARGHQNGLTIFAEVAKFMPDREITREQASKMIVKTLEANSITLPQNKISGCAALDQDQIDPTLVSYVNQMCQMGLLQ